VDLHQAAMQQRQNPAQNPVQGGGLPGSAVHAKAWTPGAGYGSGSTDQASRFVQLGTQDGSAEAASGGAQPPAPAWSSGGLPASLTAPEAEEADDASEWYVPDEAEDEFEADMEAWLDQQEGGEAGEGGQEGYWREGAGSVQHGGWAGIQQHEQQHYGGGGHHGYQHGGYEPAESSQLEKYGGGGQQQWGHGAGGGGRGDAASGLEEQFGGLSMQRGGSGGGFASAAAQQGPKLDLCQVRISIHDRPLQVLLLPFPCAAHHHCKK